TVTKTIETHTDNIETNMDENLRIPVTAEVGSGYFKMTDVSFDSDTLGKIKIRNGKSDAQMKEEDADLVITPVEGRALEVTVGQNLTFEGTFKVWNNTSRKINITGMQMVPKINPSKAFVGSSNTSSFTPVSIDEDEVGTFVCGTTFGAPIAATAGGNLFDMYVHVTYSGT
nr:Chain A, 25kDa structural protein VP25 [Shrimp white spot syndrome virus]2ED6_B Chain B, 25kDa structural protein VP25 [Shrimp white spot syndrome virus]2ED6_C Chain C, 25kDa structural protein VP25 [Shrimp white spot syndrome virus]2ED6_D Chain D, 25kDa structural protein VP25 [Shrimp white spot syndrome virus]2ED6_E Chain E, 25kDa structural protein VP25 [Shrimp white spot syndrome virus]2ED6_F Chain F, 25kDa structural protein VP25 [Shrimp white spot syndrome virus]2ED6_G Chain G, 25kDa